MNYNNFKHKWHYGDLYMHFSLPRRYCILRILRYLYSGQYEYPLTVIVSGCRHKDTGGYVWLSRVVDR